MSPAPESDPPPPGTAPPAIPLLPYLSASTSPAILLSISASEAGSDRTGTPPGTSTQTLRPLWANEAWEELAAGGGSQWRVGDEGCWGFLSEGEQDQLMETVTSDDSSRTFEFAVGPHTFTAIILRDHDVAVLTLSSTKRVAARVQAPPVRPVPSFLLPFMHTEMGQRIAEHPWEKSELSLPAGCCDAADGFLFLAASLGPMSTWSPAIRTILSVALGSPFRTSLACTYYWDRWCVFGATTRVNDCFC